eukprot:CAMPEP_0182804532 /NCGR_PEP_ID=MMETSP0006_2-20121128/4598_1 /TAXON_ID=97485 /ORGANISM="Prymnesium parvum, Strain Texoma1" /LENGTH=192 /DNA_ID=CAMNT_0024930051 /DNA_START=400 /DNA_END=979 /DNA_ORIENTATION=+
MVLFDRLQEVARRALDESLASCSVDEFCDGFSVDPSHRPVLQHVYIQAQSKLRENSLAEFDLIFNELGVDTSLQRLEDLLSEQPSLPDGSRCPVVAEAEGPTAIRNTMVSCKRRQKLAIAEALRQVDQENVQLQMDFHAQLPKLQAANKELASCMSLMHQVQVGLCIHAKRLAVMLARSADSTAMTIALLPL